MALLGAAVKTSSPGPGIRRHGKGWQVCAKYRGERSFSPIFPLNTKPAEMREWQRDEVARLRLDHREVATGSLAADVQKYLALESVKRLATYTERIQQLAEWVAALGDLRRRKITALMLEEQRDRWLTEPRPARKGVQAKPLSAAAVNKRLRALSNVWAKLDGRRAVNPVRDVAECEEPDPVARGLPYEVIEAILAAIPDTYVGQKKDGSRTTGKGLPRPSQTKARLRVIAYTGLAHGQLAKLTRADVNLEAATITVTARRKGRKVLRAQDRPLPQQLPLVPQAVAAFREFDRLKCWGAFSNSSMWKAFQRACRQIEISGLRPYDFRHSWGSMVYAETHDLRTTGALLNHRSERTTRRYTIAAVAPHIAAALERVRAKLDAGAGAQVGARASADPKISEDFSGRHVGRHADDEGRSNRETLKNSA